MARHEVTGRKPTTIVPPRIKRTGKSVAEFCASIGISRSTFETWRRRGIGPGELQPIPGGRIIITEEAEAAWREKFTTLAAVIDAAE
jgi:hypothetical protein